MSSSSSSSISSSGANIVGTSNSNNNNNNNGSGGGGGRSTGSTKDSIHDPRFPANPVLRSSLFTSHHPGHHHTHHPTHHHPAHHHHHNNLTLGYPLAWMSSSRGKPRRGMMRRAVFSDAQRQGLEKRFQGQKYISKPDRKKLAEELGLKDAQVNQIVPIGLLIFFIIQKTFPMVQVKNRLRATLRLNFVPLPEKCLNR